MVSSDPTIPSRCFERTFVHLLKRKIECAQCVARRHLANLTALLHRRHSVGIQMMMLTLLVIKELLGLAKDFQDQVSNDVQAKTAPHICDWRLI